MMGTYDRAPQQFNKSWRTLQRLIDAELIRIDDEAPLPEPCGSRQGYTVEITDLGLSLIHEIVQTRDGRYRVVATEALDDGRTLVTVVDRLRHPDLGPERPVPRAARDLSKRHDPMKPHARSSALHDTVRSYSGGRFCLGYRFAVKH